MQRQFGVPLSAVWDPHKLTPTHVSACAASACAYAHSVTWFDTVNSATRPRFVSSSVNCGPYCAFRSVHRAGLLARGEVLAFFAVAAVIREHEVVSEIGWVPGPCDEVVHVRVLVGNPAPTVEATASLDIDQHRGTEARLLRSLPSRNLFRSVVSPNTSRFR